MHDSSGMMPEQAARRVNSTDRQNDLEGARVKLKWFTPRITEMLANETCGNKGGFYRETTFFSLLAPPNPTNAVLRLNRKDFHYSSIIKYSH